MGDWDEGEHPRDDVGRFRDKVNRDNWVQAIVGRLGGVAWPQEVSFDEWAERYGGNWDDDSLHEIEGVGTLSWYAMPEQGTVSLGIHPTGTGGERFIHIADYTPRGLRNSSRLLYWAPDLDGLGEFEAEDGVDPDGMVVRSSLPSGETVGLLPDGTVRWLIPGGHHPPVDLTRSEAFGLAKSLDDAADRGERAFDDHQDELDREDTYVTEEDEEEE